MVALALAFFLADPRALACGAFDYIVADKTAVARGASESDAQPSPLPWANAVAKDAGWLFSETPFYLAKDSAWMIDPADSLLSQENTLLEIYGYFVELLAPLGVDETEEDREAREETRAELRKRILTEDGKAAFRGVFVSNLKTFPLVDRAAVEAAVETAFGDGAPAVLLAMKEQNGKPEDFGVRYFSRPSFMDSRFTPAISATCMALAYGQDYFTNPNVAKDAQIASLSLDEYRQKYLTGSFAIAFRASLIDFAAAKALRLVDPESGGLETGEIQPADGIECRLEVSASAKLERIQSRCGGNDEKLRQANPVVRAAGAQRFVQVGEQLYELSCLDSAGVSVALSESIEDYSVIQQLVSDFSAAGGKKKRSEAKSEPLIRDALEVLASLPPEDFESAKTKVIDGAARCHELFMETVGEVSLTQP